MTYHNAIKYIKKAPLSHSNEGKKYEHMRLLCEALGDPQKRLRYIRLAGSNGKTLCGGMLSTILKKAGVSVGYLAMPLRNELRTNIQINTEPISMEETVKYTQEVIAAIDKINAARRAAISDSGTPLSEPEPFMPAAAEILLAMALLAFKEKGCTLCMIESDHSGYDPSLFMQAPFAAIICGTIPSADRSEIARIRSYITRGVQEIVSAPQDQAAYKVLSDTCASVNCRLTLALKSAISIDKLSLRSTEFTYKGHPYSLNLCGRFQIVNATVVLETVEMLVRRGIPIQPSAVSEGLSSLNIHSKFEVISAMPFIIADSTHTPIAIETVCSSMADFKDIMGTSITLCLPEGELIEAYYGVLTELEYTVNKIISISESGISSATVPCPVTVCKTVKSAVKASLADLPSNEILLVSGTHSFTDSVRYELLQTLGF